MLLLLGLEPHSSRQRQEEALPRGPAGISMAPMCNRCVFSPAVITDTLSPLQTVGAINICAATLQAHLSAQKMQLYHFLQFL